MTKRFALLASVLLVSAAAYAQSSSISVFTTNVGGGWTSDHGTSYSADYGLGAEHWFTPRVSAAVNVSRHSDDVAVSTFTIAGPPTTRFYHVYEYPIDALLRYRFAGNERWKPYLGGGLRAVRAFDYPYGGRVWNLAPEINGGVTFFVTKRLGLDLDGKVVVPNQTRYTGVDEKRVSIGLSWHF